MSFVSQQFLLADSTTLANFKSWAQAISSALSSSGWTQTSDTGQVNWGTIASVPANAFVYEIWQPADALQTGSTKFYLKVEYGTDSASPGHGRIRVTAGTSTNGAGVMNGFSTTALLEGDVLNEGSIITYDCYFSGDVNRFGALMYRSGPNSGAPYFFAIERTKNTDGTDSSDGFTLIAGNRQNSTSYGSGHQTVIFGIATAQFVGVNGQSGQYYYCALGDGNNASGAFNNEIPISPIFPQYGRYGNPLTTVGFVHTQDVADGCIFTTTLYGATRTYIKCANIQVSWPGNCHFCLRYD